jgi:DNA-binding HxlR family transcriptional regulator
MPKELPQCHVEITLMMIGSKWKVLVLRELIAGEKRFFELKKAIDGVSQKVLTQQLRAMEADGLIVSKVIEDSPGVKYSLSEIGENFKPVLHAMMKWGEQYKLNSCILDS